MITVTPFDYSNSSKPFQPGLHNGFISEFLCRGFSPAEMLLTCFQQRWWCTRRGGGGVHKEVGSGMQNEQSKEHVGVRTMSCSAHWDGDTALWRCEGAGSQECRVAKSAARLLPLSPGCHCSWTGAAGWINAVTSACVHRKGGTARGWTSLTGRWFINLLRGETLGIFQSKYVQLIKKFLLSVVVNS